MSSSRSRLAAFLAAAVALTVAAAGPAEARRGGSFGSRGARTYSAPRATNVTPGYVPPVQRSMTPQTPGGYAPSRGYAPSPSYNAPAPRPGGAFRPGFGGGLLAGLVTGGLVGALMGHGFGGGWGGMGGGFGGAGMLGGLLQLAIIGFGIWLLVRLFRSRREANGYQPAYEAAGAAPGFGGSPWGANPPAQDYGYGRQTYGSAAASTDIPITPTDQQAFERLLTEVQEAFGREDYGALRERTTPEVMSYLAEELSQNATHGRRNDVSRTRLLRQEVSEAWSEGDADYATVALNYESVDLMRDRQTGAVLEGDPNTPTATTELWTFVRRAGDPWKLSAIQET